MALTLDGDNGISGINGSAATPSVQGTDTNTGLTFGTDTVGVVTGGSTRTTVDSSGRLLIGETSSTQAGSIDAKAQVVSSDFNAALTVRRNQASDGAPGVLFCKSRGTSNSANVVVSSGDGLGNIRFFGADATGGNDFAEGGAISCVVDGTPGSNDMPGRLEFKTTSDGSDGPTMRMRIDSSGRVNIGNTESLMDSGADDLVLGTGSGNNGMTIYSGSTGVSSIDFANGNSGTNRYQGIVFYDHSAQELCGATDTGNTRWRTGSTGFYPNADNSIPVGKSGKRWSAVWAANGTIQTSDQREKTEITDSVLGTDFIKSLRPVSYKWIEGGKIEIEGERDSYQSTPGTRTHWGFIAQEVKQAVDATDVDFGGWVLTDKDDPDSQQALRYDQFIAPLTKALQEAIAKIETLETRVAQLEGGAA